MGMPVNDQYPPLRWPGLPKTAFSIDSLILPPRPAARKKIQDHSAG